MVKHFFYFNGNHMYAKLAVIASHMRTLPILDIHLRHGSAYFKTGSTNGAALHFPVYYCKGFQHRFSSSFIMKATLPSLVQCKFHAKGSQIDEEIIELFQLYPIRNGEYN